MAGVWSIGEVKRDSAKVQIGAVLLCKGGKGEAEEDYRVRSTEYGKAVVQRCKSEQSSCAKVEK